jgi:hypothetical protein
LWAHAERAAIRSFERPAIKNFVGASAAVAIEK